MGVFALAANFGQFVGFVLSVLDEVLWSAPVDGYVEVVIWVVVAEDKVITGFEF